MFSTFFLAKIEEKRLAVTYPTRKENLPSSPFCNEKDQNSKLASSSSLSPSFLLHIRKEN